MDNNELLKEVLETLKRIEKSISNGNNYNGYNPWTKCRSWDDCANPHRDCINCPLRYDGWNIPYNKREYGDILKWEVTCTDDNQPNTHNNNSTNTI